MSLNCVFIGAGNLATHLAVALKEEGVGTVQVYSRTEGSAKKLADKIDASFTTSPEKVSGSASVYFVALKDDAFQSVLPRINFNNKLVVHCAGSLPLSALDSYSANTGVLYPLQTFSKERVIDFKQIPVFIEANSDKNRSVLLEIAEKISDKVTPVDSARRMALHIAAVFASNFANHCYTLADEVLKENGLQFELIRPLIQETAMKITELSPFEAQTGPAVRHDHQTIEKHLRFLSGDKELSELYKTISKSIFSFHKK